MCAVDLRDEDELQGYLIPNHTLLISLHVYSCTSCLSIKHQLQCIQCCVIYEIVLV